jgi:adenylyltransferase/sulfurtransferase
VIPGETPCLRCVFPESPKPGSAPTCDTAGVFGPAVHLIASIQASETVKLAIGDRDAVNRELVAVDIWRLSLDRVRLPGPVPDCPACGRRDLEYLSKSALGQETVLCGHDAVQVLPHPPAHLDLAQLAQRLEPAGDVLLNRFLLRFTDGVTGHELTVFPDGRAIIKGTTDPAEARRVYAQFVGV